ncbi:hypothetical protein [Mesorhizobium sp. M7A.F.Ca.MR.148.00.0.0]|uniref:hypothetical protein n=1 Tax=Mesorhizobium sp. M7A.F.Ca.MR.148.00.0.0 TaxID=2496775 RepID=UPI000FCCA271|nr:hypothetical protein [Mesorhizobium sp. M7A.F.Ca.MR.148.00.0.0]RUV37018.1 hypothetical protein EOB49_13650 [Mesorhizobium sp. M7A.F.Ca.MR.148.00.0.0]
MSDVMRDPVFWLLMILPLCAIVQLMAALYLRTRRRELLSLVEELASDDLNKEDRAWLRHEIDRSRAIHLLIATPFVPFAILGALAIAVYEGWKVAASSYNERVHSVELSADRMHRKAVEIGEGISLKKSVIWDDPRSKRVRELVGQIEDWNSPIAMVWIAAWLIAALPLLVVAYFISGSIRPFVVNLWGPLREPIASILKDTPLGRSA